MADLSDVLSGLASLVDSIVYPNGDGQPSAIVVNSSPVPARIYPGWPVSNALDSDMLAGTLNISVFAPPGMERNTTRYPRTWQVKTLPPAASITTAIDATGTIVTLGGTVSVPQNIAILANNVAVAHTVQDGDTLASIASTLATELTTAGVSASAAGSIITIAGAHQLVARVGTIGRVRKEVGRQNRAFQISFWCPTPAARDAAVKLVDPILRETNFISLSDGTTGRMLYEKTLVDDMPSKENCWRRDLFYTVEYPVTVEANAAEAIVITTTMQGTAVSIGDFTDTAPPPLVFNV